MAPRRRGSSKRGWPANLYERRGYFTWRNPLTREEFGLGTNRQQAFAQAIEANVHVTGLRSRARLVDRLTGSGDRTVAGWNERYQQLLSEADFAPNTLKSYRSLGKRMVAMLGADWPVQNVTALQISDGLDRLARAEGKARLAQALRNFLRDSFREAKVKGWWVGENPVGDTRLPVAVTVKRARLTFELFQQVRAATPLTWLRNAMDLALVTGQRREDIALARFQDFREGGWYLKQGKGGRQLFIPEELRLEVLGKSLGDVLSQCRRTGIVSHYLIHQTVERGNSPRGRRIWVDTLSHRFADAVEALGVDWSPKTPPTFHELRSLAERLYKAQGGIDTQELLGHADAATTALYHDGRGAEWTRIKVTV